MRLKYDPDYGFAILETKGLTIRTLGRVSVTIEHREFQLYSNLPVREAILKEVRPLEKTVLEEYKTSAREGIFIEPEKREKTITINAGERPRCKYIKCGMIWNSFT